MARTVKCVKLGHEAEGLDFPPYPGELGKRIYESVSKEAWQAWLRHQTMLVNENRLSLADPRARKWLARQMGNTSSAAARRCRRGTFLRLGFPRTEHRAFIRRCSWRANADSDQPMARRSS
jgi:Fe-S cluster biosynthesis and repair protein YggX